MTFRRWRLGSCMAQARHGLWLLPAIRAGANCHAQVLLDQGFVGRGALQEFARQFVLGDGRIRSPCCWRRAHDAQTWRRVGCEFLLEQVTDVVRWIVHAFDQASILPISSVGRSESACVAAKLSGRAIPSPASGCASRTYCREHSHVRLALAHATSAPLLAASTRVANRGARATASETLRGQR